MPKSGAYVTALAHALSVYIVRVLPHIPFQLSPWTSQTSRPISAKKNAMVAGGNPRSGPSS